MASESSICEVRPLHCFPLPADTEGTQRTNKGCKIPAVENLAVLQDQYDVLDLSDNDIKKLDGFPACGRLSALLVSNNSISRLGNLEAVAGLTALVLTNNKLAQLAELDRLSGCPRLQLLSLLDNPVALKPHYRLYAIFRIPSLKALDFRKVTKKERDEARRLFSSAAGAAFLAATQAEAAQQTSKAAALALTDAQKAQIKRAIERASTKEQIDLIELQLKTGTFAFQNEEVKEEVEVEETGGGGGGQPV